MPPKRQKHAIKTIVGKTFDEIVMNPDQHVLLQYNDGPSNATKEFYPKFMQLAENNPNITFGTFDTKHNEAANARTKFKEFPFLMFYTKNYKRGLIYGGEKSVDRI